MATGYTAPLRDMRFVLADMIGLDGLAALPGLDAVSADVIDQVLDQAGRFAADVLAPLNHTGDSQGAQFVNGVVRTPDGFTDAYAKWVEAGWGAASAAPEHGGMGLGHTVTTALNEMWQSANMALADGMMLTQGAADALEIHGTDEQKRLYLPKLVTGAWSGTMNLTEPGAGSDVGALRSRAVRANGAWRLTGTKIFITHGDHDMAENVVHMVLARTPDSPPGTRGISLFLVPKVLVNDDGTLGARNDLRVVSLEHKLGHHASPTCVMSYGDDEGAWASLVGTERQGMQCMFTMMNNARLAVGVQGLAIAERAYQAALDWARQRVQGTMIGERSGEPVTIIRHPDVRRMLMDMRSQTEAMRLLCYSLGAALDRARREPDAAARARAHGRADLLTPVVKAWCTDQGFEMASLGVQVHGGMGYIEETGAAQHMRDARVTMIYEGTNGIQALDLVRRKLQQDDGEAAARLVEDMRRTTARLAESDHDGLRAIAADLAPAVDAFADTTDWMRATFRDDPVAAAAGATPYLRMTGFTAGGWLMAEAAACATRRLEHASDDQAFYAAKVDSARHFAAQYLAPAAALAGPIRRAAATVMAIPEDRL